MNLEELVATFLVGMPNPRARHLAGVSGGCDSMVLLHALHAAGFRKVVVCHLDHGLRPREARGDLALVAAAAERLGYPLEFGQCDTRSHAAGGKLSIEAAARDLRLRFFETCACAHRCPRVVLAHHAGDQVETILMNLVRGTGLAGLSGMAPRATLGRLDLLRPLLACDPADIRDCAARERIAFREDSSNASPSHTRNRVRHLVAPAMASAFGPAWTRGILRMAVIVREENAWLESLVQAPGETLDVKDLRAMPDAARRRLVHRWLRAGACPSPTYAEISRVLRLLDPSCRPAKINLPGGQHARRRGGKIFLDPPAVRGAEG
jgi:tRNA(Ile)-lysidine synthase